MNIKNIFKDKYYILEIDHSCFDPHPPGSSVPKHHQQPPRLETLSNIKFLIFEKGFLGDLKCIHARKTNGNMGTNIYYHDMCRKVQKFIKYWEHIYCSNQYTKCLKIRHISESEAFLYML